MRNLRGHCNRVHCYEIGVAITCTKFSPGGEMTSLIERLHNIVALRWTNGHRSCFVESGGYLGWRRVICVGPLMIFWRWHDTQWWQHYRLIDGEQEKEG